MQGGKRNAGPREKRQAQVVADRKGSPGLFGNELFDFGFVIPDVDKSRSDEQRGNNDYHQAGKYDQPPLDDLFHQFSPHSKDG